MFMAGYRQGSGDEPDSVPGQAGHKTYQEDAQSSNPNENLDSDSLNVQSLAVSNPSEGVDHLGGRQG